MKTAFIRSKQN